MSRKYRVEPFYASPAATINHNRVRLRLFHSQGGKCWWCGGRMTKWSGPSLSRPTDVTLDHVVPRARGGADELSNLVACCQRCNRAKGQTPPERWRALA